MPKNWQEEFNEWKDNVDKATLKELLALETKEQREFFSTNLDFGTAGIRAKIGVGTNRINKYTISRYVKAYANVLIEYFSTEDLLTKGVLIFHDNRKKSRQFAKLAAKVFSGLKIKSHLSFGNELQPTPLLSYFITKREFIGGINITASHNPKEYNGIKFYNHKGSQVDNQFAKKIQENFNQITYFDIKTSSTNIFELEENFEQEYIENIIKPLIKRDKGTIKILFSPQHGTSLKLIKEISELMNVELYFVKSQLVPDEDFSGTKNPNPGSIEAFEKAIPIAINQEISNIISIDPDGDRIGLMVKDQNNWVHLNGNELAILILNFLIKTTKIKNPFIVKSIVTSDQGKRMAEKNNIKIYDTLTGFKNLSNFALKLQEESKQGNKTKKALTPLFIYEESYGSIINIDVRDKDAFQAYVLIVRVLSNLAQNKKTISSELNEINKKYGYTRQIQTTKEVSSIQDVDKYLFDVIQFFKNPNNSKVAKNIKLDYVEDLEDPKNPDQSPTPGVKVWLKGGSWIAIRPSGTEPILKFYYDFYELEPNLEAEIQEIFEKIYNAI